MLLLDTCTLLWLAGDQSRLSAKAKELIGQHADSLFLSAISAFEIALKHRRGGLRLPIEPQAWTALALQHHGITEVPTTCRIAVQATELAALHNDPCDRMIIATAKIEGLQILTPDPLIRAYPDVQVQW